MRRSAILLVVFVGALAALGIGGILGPALRADATYIVYTLLVMSAACTALAGARRAILIWTIEAQICPTLGLLGTVIGFMAALSGIVDDVSAAKMAGVETALVTTAAGMIVHLWLLVVREVTR